MTSHRGKLSSRTRGVALAALGALGCGADSTTGHELVLHTSLAADPGPDGEFTSETGWTITLSRAALSVGALYYFDGPPAFAQQSQPWLRPLWELVGVSTAYAHPGHYLAGNARGQMTSPAVIALSGEPVALPDGVGISGMFRSARMVLSAPGRSELLPEGVVALAEGVAQQGGKTVHFRLAASADEVDAHASRGEIDGCVFGEQEITRDGTVAVTVLPHVWFDLVDFADVAPGEPDAPTELGTDDTARIAFVLGVAQLSAYRFAYTPSR